MKAPLYLEKAFDPRCNAIAFVRMVLAAMVVFSHCCILGGFGFDVLGRLTGNRENFGFLGVTMFFVLSGFLITRSALNTPSVKRFLWHRFLRIFPGYCTVLAVSAFLFAPVFYRLEYGSYLGVFSAPGSSPVSYFFGNAGMFHPNFTSIASVMNIHPASIATLFLHNPSPRIFNGSLWSLPYECLCYFGVGVVAAVGVLGRRRHLGLVCLALLVGLYGFDSLAHQRFDECFPVRGFGVLVMLALYFCVGSTAYLYREKIRMSWLLLALALAVTTVSLFYPILPLTAPLVFPYILFWLVCQLPVTRFDALGDFSYGAYIYAFPVQQGLVLLHIHRAGFFPYLLGSCVVTLFFAILSYHLVEAPALRLKNANLTQFMQRITAKLFVSPGMAGVNSAAE